jgi:hypothetical protein
VTPAEALWGAALPVAVYAAAKAAVLAAWLKTGLLEERRREVSAMLSAARDAVGALVEAERAFKVDCVRAALYAPVLVVAYIGAPFEALGAAGLWAGAAALYALLTLSDIEDEPTLGGWVGMAVENAALVYALAALWPLNPLAAVALEAAELGAERYLALRLLRRAYAEVVGGGGGGP